MMLTYLARRCSFICRSSGPRSRAELSTRGDRASALDSDETIVSDHFLSLRQRNLLFASRNAGFVSGADQNERELLEQNEK
jgi:hypothetical protein